MRASLISTLMALTLIACTPNQEPMRYVEAIEIPMDVQTERHELATILAAAAKEDGGLHVDDTTVRTVRFHADSKALEPNFRPTISMAVWRGDDDNQLVASVTDTMHRGRVWATFNRGEDPDQESHFRRSAVLAVKARWPRTKTLPILPSGGLPHARDIISTPDGYRIKFSEAGSYELELSSALLERSSN